MAMTVSDTGRALLDLDEDAATTAVVTLLEGPGQQWSIITVATGDTWSTTGTAARTLGLVALEGCATCSDEEGRQSIGSGHIVTTGEGESITLTNEGPQPFRALLACTGAHITGDTN